MGRFISLVYLLVVACTLYRAAPLYSRWLNRQPLFVAIFALVGGIVLGAIGQSMGLSTLFWHEKPLTQLIAGMAVGALLVIMGVYSFDLDENKAFLHTIVSWEFHTDLLEWKWPRERDFPPAAPVHGHPPVDSLVLQLRDYLNALAVPVLVVVCRVPIVAQLSPTTTAGRRFDELDLSLVVPAALVLTWLVLLLARRHKPGWLGSPAIAVGVFLVFASVAAITAQAPMPGAWNLPLGTLMVLAFVNLSLRLLACFGFNRPKDVFIVVGLLLCLATLVVVATQVDYIRERITAALSICLLMVLVATISYVTYRRALLKVGLLVVALLVATLTNGLDPFKLTYPGLDRFYPKYRLDPDNRLVRPPAPVRAEPEEVDQATLETAQAQDGLVAKLQAPEGATSAEIAHFKDALAALQRAVGRVRKLSASAALSERDAVTLMDLGRAYYQQGKGYERCRVHDQARSSFQSAADEFARIIRLRPNDARAYTDRATALLKLSGSMEFDPESQKKDELLHRAEQLCREAILLEPSDTLAYRTLGIVFAVRSDFSAAAAHLDKALKIKPDDPENLVTRGYVRLMRVVAEVTKIPHSGAPPEALSGAQLERVKSIKEAELDSAFADLNEAVRIAPNNEAGFAYRAVASILRDQKELARKDLNRAIELNPENATTRNNRAMLRLQAGKYAEAAEDLEAAIRSSSGRERSALFSNLGFVYRAIGTDQGKSPAEAIPLLKKAYDAFDQCVKLMEEKYAIGLWQRGDIRIRLMDRGAGRDNAASDYDGLKAALRDLDRAAHLDPYNVEIIGSRFDARIMLAESYAKASRSDEVRRNVDLALEDLKTRIKQADPSVRVELCRKAANFVSEKIGKAQAEQFESLLCSVLCDDPVPALTVPTSDANHAHPSDVVPQPPSIVSPSSFQLNLHIPDVLPGRLDDLEILERWRDAHADNPKLVVVATSGGGIVAAYWTAVCLTRLEELFPAFPYHIRVVTGASGGMLGAAHYIASLPVPKTTSRSSEVLDTIRRDLAKDCLTPVVRQMVLADLPSIFDPRRQANDRGRVLEKAWEQNTRAQSGVDTVSVGLATEFLTLARGEEEGWRPSLIVSPTIVEGGSRLLISNLDLEGLSGGTEFFRLFPGARLKLSTAVRMNAAFPYVSPAVNLPTAPPRRVVDAGYLDNYGIDLATEWLARHRHWLRDHIAGGVILVQIRAYPIDLTYRDADNGNDDGPHDGNDDESPPAEGGGVLADFQAGFGDSIEWLTAPFEGLLSANKGTMIANNNSKVRQLEALFNTDPHRETPYFRTFVFECTESAPLSWYLTSRDRDRLERSFQGRHNRRRAQQLANLLRGGVEPSATPRPSDRQVRE